jgi:hypothetical protein
MSERAWQPDAFGIDWASGPSFIALHCPFGAGYSVSLYVEWADVPDWWPCTCGAEHAKPKPGKNGILDTECG